MAKNSPAFQFYTNDWLSSPSIMLMTPAEEGAYIRLLAICWARGGTLPDDDEQLAALSRLGEDWLKGSSTKIKQHFEKKGKVLINERLQTEMMKQQQWRKKCVKGGVASGKSRKSKRLQEKEGGKGISRVLQTKRQLKGNTSSSYFCNEDEDDFSSQKEKKSSNKGYSIAEIFEEEEKERQKKQGADPLDIPAEERTPEEIKQRKEWAARRAKEKQAKYL